MPFGLRFTARRSGGTCKCSAPLLGATQVTLQLGQLNDHVRLVLEDNGTGFDVPGWLDGVLSPEMRGIGLQGHARSGFVARRAATLI